MSGKEETAVIIIAIPQAVEYDITVRSAEVVFGKALEIFILNVVNEIFVEIIFKLFRRRTAPPRASKTVCRLLFFTRKRSWPQALPFLMIMISTPAPRNTRPCPSWASAMTWI